MAEEGKNGECGVVAEGVRGPETGSAEMATTVPKRVPKTVPKTVHQMARCEIDNHPEVIMTCLKVGVAKGDIRCLKMLLDLGNGVGLSEGIPEAEYRSFAEELRELFRLELEEMEGTKDRA